MATDETRRRAGTIVRGVMEERGWSQRQLADAAGVVEKTINQFLKGASSSPRTRSGLDRAFGWPDGTTTRLCEGTLRDVPDGSESGNVDDRGAVSVTTLMAEILGRLELIERRLEVIEGRLDRLDRT